MSSSGLGSAPAVIHRKRSGVGAGHPTIVVDAAIAQHLEILRRVLMKQSNLWACPPHSSRSAQQTSFAALPSMRNLALEVIR